MLHIAGGIILAVLFLNLLPVLLATGRLLFFWLFQAIIWLSVIYAATVFYVSLPFIIEDIFGGPDIWFWLSLAAIGTFIIVRKALSKPTYHRPLPT